MRQFWIIQERQGVAIAIWQLAALDEKDALDTMRGGISGVYPGDRLSVVYVPQRSGR